MRWRILLLAILAIALTVIAIMDSANGDVEWSQIVRRGDAYRDAYLYTAAGEQYRQALDLRPRAGDVLLRLCDISWRMGRLDEAASYADRAGAAGADLADVAQCRARVAEAGGQADEAAEQWAVVVAAQPDERDARVRLIDALIAAHEWPAAIAQIQALLDANPNDETALFYRSALLALDDPLRAQAHLGQLDTAEASALVAALDDPLGLANRSYRAVLIGRVFLDFDRLPLAWRAFVDAVAEAPTYPDAFAYLGITYDRLGDESLAGANLDRALELDDESAIGLYLRGVYLSRHAKWAEARLDLMRASHLDPENAPVAFALGRVLAEQKEYSAAEEYFGRAIAREPDNFDWQLALAELYIGRLIRLADWGVPAAQRAVDLDPDSAQARDWLGWGLHLLGDELRAEFELRVAIDLDPTLARARLHLGNLLIDAGRIEEGRTELFRAADLDPRGEVGVRARQLLGAP